MNIQVIDFPSDAEGETYKLREELTKCLQRACISESGAKKLKEVIKFSISKLQEADAARAEIAKAAAEEAALSEVVQQEEVTE